MVRFSVAIITPIVYSEHHIQSQHLVPRNGSAGGRFLSPAKPAKKMTDWKILASAADPPIPAEDIEKAVPVLEALEAAFRPLVATIPDGEDFWTGPEDAL